MHACFALKDKVARCIRTLTGSWGSLRGAGERLGCPWTEARTGLQQHPWKTQSSTQGSFNQIKKTTITPREDLMPIPIIKTHILHSFAFNFSLSLSLPASDSLSLAFPSALLFSSLFSIRTPLAVAERYSHFQSLCCHALPLSPV